MGKKCEGNCGLWVLNEILKKHIEKELRNKGIEESRNQRIEESKSQGIEESRNRGMEEWQITFLGVFGKV